MTDARHLQESLSHLRAEVEALDIRDEAARRRLDDLLRDIRATLDDPREAGTRRSLGEQLQGSILSFEATHPRLAALMNEVMEKLGHMGI